MSADVTNDTTSASAGPLPVHLIGNAHMDPVWIWDWREGFGEVWATFRSALDRLLENDDVVFTASSAAYYAWIERHDPSMFAEIRTAVAAGRWCVVGGMWIEPDCNIPSGESFARQLLLGQRYFRRAFGRPATIGYNVDSFGHAAGLANLLLEGGLRGYVMMRPQEHERDLPAHAFRWSDPRGRDLVTYRIPLNYETESVDVLVDKLAALAALSDAERLPQMCFYGIGNHGGGPTKRMIAALDYRRSITPSLRHSDPERYFGELASVASTLPSVLGELQHHAVGCYSVSAWVKAANRRGEVALQDAETFDALARRIVAPGPRPSGLTHAWEELALCQFHDILAGTSSTEAYRTVRSRYGFVETVADEVTTNAAYQLGHLLDTRVEGIGAQERESFWAAQPDAAAAFVVFNPLAWTVRQTVRAPRHAARVLDSAGRELASQQVASGEATAYRTHSIVSLELGPLGYEVIWLQGGSGSSDEDAEPARVDQVANERFRVKVDPATGALVSVVDLVAARELVRADGVRPLVLRDVSDTWSHGVVRYDGDELPLDFEGSELVEAGPLRSTLRLRFRCGDSALVEDVILESAPARLQIRLRAWWSEPRSVVKLVLPWNLGDGVTNTAGAAYSYQDRTPTGGEEPFQGWLDTYDPERGEGVALITDHLYGYDATGPAVRLSVLRNPIAADHGRGWARRVGEDFVTTDRGEHDVRVDIVAHDGDWRQARLPARAEEMSRPAVVIAETYHAGALAGRGAFLVLDPLDLAVVRQVKRAEDDDGIVLRLVETLGRRAAGTLGGEVLGRSVDVDLVPYEVATLLVPDDPSAPVRRLSLAELDVENTEDAR